VGPTTTNFVDGRPQTDDVVNFEDLMMFAINFGQVSRQPVLPQAEYIEPGLALVIDDATVAPDRILARLVLANEANVVKGIHSVVSFDAAGLELVGVRQGTLLERASGAVFFKSLEHEKGVLVDAAIFGTDRVLEGSGEIAVLEFRVRDGGRPVLDEVVLRDARNRIPGTRTEPVVAQLPVDDDASIARGLPTRLELVGARPNPFSTSTDISFRIPSATQVSVSVYDVAGRLIRTLVDRTVEPGEVTVTWDGRSDDGHLTGAGVYFYVFQAQDKRETRKLLRIR
jgi:hypothetical protein